MMMMKMMGFPMGSMPVSKSFVLVNLHIIEIILINKT